MKKTKEYKNTWFSADVIRQAAELIKSEDEKSEKKDTGLYMSVELDGETWHHDSEEEFFADYRKSDSYATYAKTVGNRKLDVTAFYNNHTTIEVQSPTREEIEKIFEVFEKHKDESRLPEPPKPPKPKPTVFIGHGRSQLWRDLKDHLHEKHGYSVEAYEVGSRAGHAVRDILEKMLERSSFAVLIMTGEDKTDKGTIRARQNVIHEIGLFQGRLGFSKAIVLLEKGTEGFSNLQGIDQIRFSKGNIKETFGDVLATLRREFGVQN